jgi:type IV pilus assembly protein PilE
MKSTLRPDRLRGFTLIELMVVVAIAAILAMIAIPAYTAQIRKSHRTEARTALLDLASREERFYSSNAAYTNLAASLGYPAPDGGPWAVGSGYYQLQITNWTATSFTAQAVPQNTQTQDTECATFSLTNTGLQNITGTGTVQTCWN